MPELPVCSETGAIRALECLGFRVVRQRGSHVMLRKGMASCVVPLHRELKRGTLTRILCQADVNATDFINALS